MKRFALKTLALLACLLCSLSAVAAEAYAEYTPENTTLTFYYDDYRSSSTGTTYDLNEGNNDPGWYSDGTRSSVTRVVFDSSFASARPTSTRRWFSKMSKLTSITRLNYLNTSEVTNMVAMFNGCSKLTSLTLTGFNTAKVTNMSSMFQDCSGLTSLNVGNFNMTNVTMLMSMFDNCSSLTSLDLSGWNTANMTNINFMFERCSSLITIYVGSGWTTNTVTSTGSVFNGCTSLVGGMGTTYDTNHLDKTYAHLDGGTSNPGYFSEKPNEPYACYTLSDSTLTFYNDNQRYTRAGTTYDLNTGTDYPSWPKDVTSVVFEPSFADVRPTTTRCWFGYMNSLKSITGIQYLNTSQVTDMSDMFFNCRSLTSLDLSSLNTANVTNMTSMLSDCTALTSLDLSGWNTANVTSMWCMFNSSTSLTSLDLSGWNTANVTNMVAMFYYCSSLKTIYVGDEWSTSAVTNSVDMFLNCTNIRGSMGTTYDENHTNKAYAHIDGGPSNPGYFTAAPEPYAVLTSNNSTLTFYYDGLRSTRTGLTFDMNTGNNRPGWSNYSFEKVVFDPSFADARPTSTYYWFGFRNVKTISGIEYFNTANVTDMSYMFYHCSELTSLDLSSLNTANVTNMSYMFEDCYRLTSLNLSGWNTANVTDMSYMFEGCWDLTSLDVSGWNTANVTNMSYMFEGCWELTSLDLSSWNAVNVTDMKEMFDGCRELTSLDLSSFNTANVTDMSRMFYGCSNLSTIYAGGGWSTAAVTSSGGMFGGCNSLVGGQGTTFNGSHVDATYAHIDGGPSNPGYFTDINHPKEAYACYTPSNTTLTFYYDTQRSAREGTTYLLPEPNANPGWYGNGINSNITQAVFDRSFAGTRPTSTRRWFYYHSNLQSITGMNYLNTSRVTNMNSMFEGCSKLTSIDVSNFVTDNVTDMSAMFYQCRKLESLDVTNFNTANVTNMSSMFTGLRLITDLDLSNFNTANVIEMNFMFASCVALTTLDLHNFNTAKVKGMQRMFNGCSALTTIYVACQWTTDMVTSHTDMFTGCTNLVGGMGTTYDASHVDKAYAHIDGGPSNPGYLTEFLEPYACFTLDNRTFTFYYDSQRGSRPGITYDLNTGDYSPLWSTTPSTLDYISRVVFDPSFAGARPTSTCHWFYYMSDLQSIIGMNEYLNTSEVTNMEGMFCACTSLTNLDLSSFNTSNVTTMKNMFGSCTSLTSLDLSSFNTENVTNMGFMFYMFYPSNALTFLDLSNFNTVNVTDMQYMFYGNSGLTTIYAGRGWSTDAVTTSNSMFSDCTSLVGGMGTTYDRNHVDKEYARIDGGPAMPGYLSKVPVLRGDVNGDGVVNIADVTEIIDYMLYGDEVDFNFDAADTDGNGRVNIGDVADITDYILYGHWF